MTQFNKSLFNIDTSYKGSSTYMVDGKHEFVARFRTAGIKTFVNFLIKNFTVEEYFGRLKSGDAPLTIAESKGYLLPHVKKLLKVNGYPVTIEGFREYIKNQSIRKVS